jgi:hypothetical protein
MTNTIKQLRIDLKRWISEEDDHRSQLKTYKLLSLLEGSRNDHWGEQMEHNIKYSLYKEKFYRYLYNADYKKYHKYHEKMLEIERENMDNFMEQPDKSSISVIDSGTKTFTHKDQVDKQGDNGFKVCCDTYKEAYDFRKMLMNCFDNYILYCL